MPFSLRFTKHTEPIVYYSLISTLFLVEKGLSVKKSIQEKYWNSIIIINDNFISFYYLFEPKLKNKFGSEINEVELMSLNFKNNQLQNNNWEEDAVLIFLGFQTTCPSNMEYMQVITTTKIISRNALIQRLCNLYSKYLKSEENILVLYNKKNVTLVK